TESQLVRINKLRLVNPAEWTTGVGNSGFNVRAVSDDSPLDTILIRIDRDVETYNAPAPPEPFDLRGIGGQFDATSPFSSGYQVLPRYNADISTYGVGTKESQLNIGVLVSPNPATDVVTVKTDASLDRLTIYDVTGRMLISVTPDSTSLNLNISSLQPGIYFLRLQKENAFSTVRFTKQ
ncbi:MAG: T9SS type A sorting domain-containing protein, partial [Bacteroidota bacterium]